MKQYIPINLNIDQLLEEFPPNKIRNFNRDKLIHLINLLSEIPANRERFESHDGFISLNAKMLRKHLGKNYKEYLNYLIESGVIETDNRYIVGEKSKGYRFTDKYLCEVEEIEIVTYTLVRSIKKETKIEKTTVNTYPYLVRWFDDRLEIDYQSASQYIQKNKSQLIDSEDYNPYQVYNSTYINLNRFADHHYFIKVDDTGNRFHSNFTNLKKEFRQFICYDKEGLVAVDISNSQPYLSMILFNPEFYSKTSEFNIYTLDPNSFTSFSSSYPTGYYFSPPPMMYKSLKNKEKQDVIHFKKLVKNGELYEYFGRKLEHELGQEKISIEEVKKILFKVFYSSNRYIGQAEAKPKRIFKKLFPNIYDVYSEIKRRKKNSLAILLQRIESHLILDIICKRIAMEKPNLPIYTIHDCIVTTLGNEHYVCEVMEAELTKHIGISPKLKKEYWTNKT